MRPRVRFRDVVGWYPFGEAGGTGALLGLYEYCERGIMRDEIEKVWET
jgi:hypothetical protein